MDDATVADVEANAEDKEFRGLLTLAKKCVKLDAAFAFCFYHFYLFKSISFDLV